MPKQFALVLLRGFLAALIVGWVVLALGTALPRLLIGTGTGELQGEEADFAGFARFQVKEGGVLPFFRDLTLVHVTEVKNVPVSELCRASPTFPPNVAPRGYEARYESYLPFGILLGKGTVGCTRSGLTSFRFGDREMRFDTLIPLAPALVLYEVNRWWAFLAVLSVPVLVAGGVVTLRTGVALDRRLGVAALASVLLLAS